MDSSNFETRIAIVEKELGTVVNVFQKFDATIDKLTEVSQSLKELMAVHDNRLIEREKADVALLQMIEKRKDESDRGVERIHSRLDEVTESLTKQVRAEMDERNNRVMDAIKELRAANKENFGKIEGQITNLKHEREKVDEQRGHAFDNLAKRVADLEKWRWVIAGGATVLGFLIGKWDVLRGLIA